MRVIARRHRPLLAVGEDVMTYHFGSIYLLNIITGKAKLIASLPINKFQKAASRIRIIERLLRLEAKAAVSINEEQFLISYRGSIFRIELNSGTITKEHTYRRGMNNPLLFAKIEGITGFDDCIAYGEYTLNPHRENSSAIYTRSFNSTNWEKAYEFPVGTVRHIHGIAPDKASDCVYIFTGDLDDESGIWESRDNFKTVKPVIKGSQKYRTGLWYSVAGGYIYPTDTAIEQNHIYLAIRNADDSLKVNSIFEIDGSCISSLNTKDTIFISTTVEADENITGWKSWLNCKKGAGIKSDYAQLLSVDKQTLSIRKIVEFKKDILPYKLFQYGSILMVDLPTKESILAYPIGVKKYDGKLLLIECKDKGVK